MFADHDAHIDKAPKDLRPLLVRLRAQLARALPDAEEVIAYKMPGFRIGQSIIAGYAAFSKQCGLYYLLPPSSRTPATLPRPGSSPPRPASPSRRASQSLTGSSGNSRWLPEGTKISERQSRQLLRIRMTEEI
jgi:hypothetical protein